MNSPLPRKQPILNVNQTAQIQIFGEFEQFGGILLGYQLTGVAHSAHHLQYL